MRSKTEKYSPLEGYEFSTDDFDGQGHSSSSAPKNTNKLEVTINMPNGNFNCLVRTKGKNTFIDYPEVFLPFFPS